MFDAHEIFYLNSNIALQADVEKLLTPKVFVLVSTVMTWAKSKPLDPEDPEIPFTDEDYRRRKPHPAFKEHCSAEKTVLKCGKAVSIENKLVLRDIYSRLRLIIEDIQTFQI